MDTSETYIKMCEKAEEIQHNHKWEYGDWFVAEHTVWQIGTASFVYEADEKGLHHRLDKPCATLSQTELYLDADLGHALIWLPRQDQLQEMASKYFAEAGGWEDTGIVLLGVFRRWILDNGPYLVTCKLNQASMEQLWLAFVMKEKYGKVWNGEEWIKEENAR